MSRAEEQALKAYPRTDDAWDESNVDRRIGYIRGYEQAIEDMQKSFKKMQASVDCAIDAVEALNSIVCNPRIKDKLME